MRVTIALLLLGLLASCGGGGGGGGATDTPGGEHDKPVVETDPRCVSDGDGPNWTALAAVACPRLADYRLFTDATDPRHGPRAPGMPYAPASPLFSDYAHKYRFVFMPDGVAARYREKDGLVFPVGTVLVKTFALPFTVGEPEDRLVETRLLIHRADGWVGLPFRWQADGRQATLAVTGAVIDTYVVESGVQKDFRYQIPDQLTCRKCHQGRVAGEVMTPLGTTVRQLNHDYVYDSGAQNQLQHWQQQGRLDGLPSGPWPRAVDWHDTDEPLALRVKSYLDSNCSHCHSDVGSGALSGLRLEFWRDENSYSYGICNRSQGYYGGPDHLSFDIVPGDARASVMPFRLGASRSEEGITGKDVMPPLGRSLADHEAAALLRQWIDQMPAQHCGD